MKMETQLKQMICEMLKSGEISIEVSVDLDKAETITTVIIGQERILSSRSYVEGNITKNRHIQ